MERKALADKILILGIDGMDPRFTKYMLDKGEMPNLKKLVDNGAQREDLVLQGMMPTITPPMWATLATGAYANTHGVTCFWRQSKEDLDVVEYNFDSRKCQAEQLWNVLAEAGKKTLVFHWPSAAWPPSSDSPNLFVIDGTSPGYVNATVAAIDAEKMIYAGTEIKAVVYQPKVIIDNGAGCVLHDIDVADQEDVENLDEKMGQMGDVKLRNIELTTSDGEGQFEEGPIDTCNSPIKAAAGWVKAPSDALEFTIVTYKGLISRPALILKNAKGSYDTVEIYKSKKETTPLCRLTMANPVAVNVIDDIRTEDGEVKETNRVYTLLEVSADGSKVRLHAGSAMDIHVDKVFHPKEMYQEIIQNVGYVEGSCAPSGKSIEFMEKIMLPSWLRFGQWQADSMKFLIDKYDMDVVFSHFHNCDSFGHCFLQWVKGREWGNDPKAYQALFEQGYRDTDEYIAQFMPLYDKGWTILVVSDHGLICSEHEMALMGDPFGVNAAVMADLGYTVLKTDEQGNRLKEIDWEKTRAVAARGNHIYINLKGRDKHGIVEMADKYALEDQIITDLFKYQDPKTGKRIIGVAMRNKEAAIVGMSGPECGDIIYWNAEGFNRAHGDSLSTYLGDFHTSVSPIFVACGKGLKQGYRTKRVIRQVDVAPTIAVLAGVRMPNECEGAPVYQIIAE